MNNSRLTSVLLLTTVSSLAALPVSAGQVAHRIVARRVPAPAQVVYRRATTHVIHVTRITHVHTRVHEVVRERRSVVETHGGEAVVICPSAVVVTSSAVVPAENTHRWGTSIAASSAILTAPSPDAKVIKRIPAGTHIPDIIGEENGYYQYVRWTHKIAYVAKSDIQLDTGTASVVTAPREGEPVQ